MRFVNNFACLEFEDYDSSDQQIAIVFTNHFVVVKHIDRALLLNLYTGLSQFMR